MTMISLLYKYYTIYYWKAAIFEHDHDYDVTVTSYLGVGSYFGMKKDTHSYTIVSISCIFGFDFQVHRVVVNHSLLRRFIEKGLERRGLI